MGGKNAHELALLDQAGQALSEARSLDEIKTVRDKAEAVRKYAQSASLGLDVQNRAAEVKLRAERGLSQEALANEAHIHRTYITHLEGKVRNTGIDVLDRLAAALKVPISRLFEQG